MALTEDVIKAPSRAFQKAIAAYLSLPDVAQLATMTGGSHLLNFAMGASQTWWQGALSSPQIPGAGGVQDFFDGLIRELMNPNLGGVIIKADSERCTRSVEVSENVVIRQQLDPTASVGTDWIVDNASPRPRQWTIRGHLTMMLPWIDGWLTLKPSIIVQQMWLDGYAQARQPIWYKNSFCQYYKVLVKNFEWEHVPTATNALAINLELEEFVVYEAPVVGSLYGQAQLTMKDYAADDVMRVLGLNKSGSVQ